MMHAFRAWVVVCALVGLLASAVVADTFGTGANQFTIDFVPISGATNPASGSGIVNNDYRMGRLEISNDQWTKFKAELGVPVTGNPSGAYDVDARWTDTNVPTNNVSWCEAAQFVNWLNTSRGHQAAYKFTGTQGTGDYTLASWNVTEASGGTNLYRHKDAFYYLPTDHEWVKAAYWNGISRQTYATADGVVPIAGVDTRYGAVLGQPWNVGSCSEELNGTYDMMGNVWEWMESPYSDANYGAASTRGVRGGAYYNDNTSIASSYRTFGGPNTAYHDVGFRVASDVPEPSSLVLISLGGWALFKRRRGA